MKDVRSGESFVVEPGGSLFSVAFVKHPGEFYETQAAYSVDGSGARNRWYKVVPKGASKTVELHYDGCPVGLDGGTADVVVHVTSTPDASFYKWNLQIHNRSDVPLGDVRFPTLKGLGSSLAGSAKSDYLVAPVMSGKKIPSPRSTGGCDQGLTEIPSPACSIQMLSYCDGLNRSSLYLAAEDTASYRKAMLSSPMTSKKSFQWHILHYSDGATVDGLWKLPYEVACGPVRGDWYDAAKVYRKWASAQSRWKLVKDRADIPEWFKSTSVWYQGQDRNQEPDNMASFVQHLLKIRNVLGEPYAYHIYLWQKGRTHDVGYPDYFPAMPGFADAVSTLRDAGVELMPYINVEIFDTNTAMWTNEKASRWASRNQAGDLNKLGWGHNEASNAEESDTPGLATLTKVGDDEARNVNMCPRTQYWQDKIFSCINTLVKDYGVNAVYLDELHVYPFACYSKKHGHADIGGRYFADAYKAILNRAREQSGKKDLVLTGEHFSETYADMISGQLSFADTRPDSLPMFQAAMKDCTIEFGMMMKRSDIENLNTFAGKIGFQLVRGRQLGWINFDQSDILDPSLSAQMDFLRKAARCRKATREFLLDGEFLREPDMSEVGKHKVSWDMAPMGGGETLELPGVFACVYKSPSGDIGIVSVNVTDKPLQIEIPVNEKDWGLKVGQVYSRSDWKDDVWAKAEVAKMKKSISMTIPAYSPLAVRLQSQSIMKTR